MKPVFADAAYWIALTFPQDSLHPTALKIAADIGSRSIVTTEMVLTEYLDGTATRGRHIRENAIKFVRGLYEIKLIEIVPNSSELFQQAVRLYAERTDKNWSLTDCASFTICSGNGIDEVLTHDQHFVQAGFRALMRT